MISLMSTPMIKVNERILTTLIVYEGWMGSRISQKNVLVVDACTVETGFKSVPSQLNLNLMLFVCTS